MLLLQLLAVLVLEQCLLAAGFPGLVTYLPQDAFIDARERFGLDETLRQEFMQQDFPPQINMPGGCNDRWTVDPNKPELKLQ